MRYDQGGLLPFNNGSYELQFLRQNCTLIRSRNLKLFSLLIMYLHFIRFKHNVILFVTFTRRTRLLP